MAKMTKKELDRFQEKMDSSGSPIITAPKKKVTVKKAPTKKSK
jgi:hypothetical protein